MENNKKKNNNKLAKIIVTLGSLLVIGVAVWSLTYKTPEKTNLDLKEESIKVTETKTEVKKEEVNAPEVKTEVKKEEAKPEVKAEEPKEIKEVEKKEEVKAEAREEAPKAEAKVEAAEPVETKTETKVETKPAAEVKKPVATTKPATTTKPAETKPATTKPVATTKPSAPAPKPVAPKPATPAPKPVAPAPKPATPAPKPAPTQPKPVAPAPKPAVTVVSTTTETKEEIRDVVKFTSTTKLNNTQYTDWSAVEQAGKDGFTKYTLSRTVTKMSDGTIKYGEWKTTSTVVEPMVPEIIAKGTMERSKEGWDYEAIDGVIAEIDKYRASKGLPQATYTKTNYAAKVMAERGFNHFGGAYEIISFGMSPYATVRGWIRSGGHRTTLELPGNVHYFVGAYRDAKGHIFYSVALEG